MAWHHRGGRHAASRAHHPRKKGHPYVHHPRVHHPHAPTAHHARVAHSRPPSAVHAKAAAKPKKAAIHHMHLRNSLGNPGTSFG